MIVKLSLLILTIFSGIALAGTGLAANHKASNITVRPFLEQVTIKPGDKQKEFDLIINNGSDFAQAFRLSTLNFGALNETGGIVFQGANVSRLANKYGLAKWLQLEKAEIQLAANQQATLKVTIKNDAELTPGGHYAAIIVTASKPNSSAGQLTVTPKVSSLVFATKTGGESYDMHLESFSHNGNTWRLPNQVSVRLKSTGNTFIVPRGIVMVKQNNNIVARGVINEQSSLVLPENIRNFDVHLTNTSKLKQGFIFTRYKVQVDYRYDGVNEYASTSNTYTLINKLTLIVLASLMFVAGLIFKHLKYVKAKPKKPTKRAANSRVVKLSRLNK